MDRRFSFGVALAIAIAGLVYALVSQMGSHSEASSNDASAPVPTAKKHPAYYVLAATWMPAFCTLRGYVPECRAGATPRFTLHGLWPAGEYCNISADVVSTDEVDHWSDLPPIQVSDATWSVLRAVMPGTKSHLERHEWVAHGSCAGVSQEVFFARAAALLTELRTSTVGKLFELSGGKRLTRAKIAAAFDQAFGSGAGKRVRLSCEEEGSNAIIDEVLIALFGDPFAGDPLEAMINDAHPRSGGCEAGLVTP